MAEVEKSLQRLRHLGSQVPRLESPYPLEAPQFGPGCTEAEVQELLGGAFARVPDYVEFLRACRRIDAADVYNGYFLYSPLGIVGLAGPIPRILHIDMKSVQTEVRVLAVGGDGGGNHFLLSVGPEEPGHVWRWSHEFPVRFDGVATDGLTSLATCFGDFLARIVEDWEHFLEGDTRWHYMTG